MHKDILIQLPYIFIQPQRYFREVIVNRTFVIKDLFYTAIGLFPIITILHIMESEVLSRFQTGLETFIYVFAFVLGLTFSLSFRTYFLTMVLKKMGHVYDYKSVGMIVGVSMIMNIIMILLPLIIQSADLNIYFEIVFRFWNLILILIGLVCLTKIRWIRIALVLLVMFGFEFMFRYLFGGIRL
ncbi:hypothetical protein [Labilibaculum antarcticum]|uniref:Yip1 domain-containing protein n=1 Tax=Labilibaculum antarcticum TaxID=1717717 RepID=A0A1Y1CM96_9BACT|nr:hypothetical protein [Labilibaculum antarcticum]BAX81475.1 hypothetical protein ALGA_3175 [Labilibaculum antarcticum]